MSDNNNVRVYVRVRPLNDTEKMGGPQQCIKPDTEHHSIDMNTKPEPRRFTYDHVAGIDSTQEDVFQKVGRTITDTCLAGYNGTIFAYGQTGSGKTFTIQGKDGSNRGLMPRVFNYLCGQIAREERKQGSKVTFQCSSSFLEIYNDRIYDLLDSKPIQSRVALNIREDKKKGVFVDNLTEEVVKTADEMLSVMQRGIDNRRVGSTAMNMESSRSHSVFSIAIRSTEMRDGLTVEKYSRFNLIDLAGSERQKATNATGDRLKEASRINKSLSALGNVINALVERARTGKSKHVHYRDSKLTFLLKDSLGGNSMTYIIACVSPAAINFGETLSTLKFAQRAKHIKNNAVVNEDQTGNVANLQQENARLRTQLMQYQALQTANTRRLSLSFTSPTKRQARGNMKGGMTVGLPSLVEEHEATISAEESASLNALLTESIDREKEWKLQCDVMKENIASLTELGRRHQRTETSNKMIIQLRERAIRKLQSWFVANRSGSGEQVKHEDVLRLEIERLNVEAKELRSQIQHNPALIELTLKMISLEDTLGNLREKCKRNGVSIDDVVSVSDAAIQNSNKRTGQKLSVRFAITDELLTLRELKTKHEKELKELKEKLENPQALLDLMTAQQRRRFESFELEKWKNEQQYEKKLQLAKAQLTEEKQKAVRLKECVSMHENQNKELCNQLKTLQQTLSQERAAFEAKVLRHEMELARCVEKSNAELTSTKEAYESQFAAMENGIQESALESAQNAIKLKDTETKLTYALEESQSTLKQFEEAHASITVLNEQLKTMEKKTQDLQDDLEQQTKTHAEEKAELQKRIDDTEADLASTKDSLSATVSELEARSSTVSELTTEVETLTVSLETEGKKLQACQEELEGVRAKLSSLEQVNECKEKEIDRLNWDIENLQEDHDSLMEEFKFTTSNYDEEKVKSLALSKQLEEREKANECLEGECKSLKEQISKIKEELDSTVKVVENSVPASDYNRAVQQRKELETQLELCSDALKEKTKAVENMEEEAEAFRVQISELRETESSLASSLADMRKVYADIEVQYTDSQSELRNMQDENEGLKETVTEIKASNTKQSAEIVDLESTVEGQQQSMAKMDEEHVAEIAQLEQKLDIAEQSLELVTAENEDNVQKLFAAKIALESATNEIGSMEIQLKQEKEESEQLHALNCGVLNEKHQKAIDAVQAQVEAATDKNTLLASEAVTLKSDLLKLQSRLTDLEGGDGVEGVIPVLKSELCALTNDKLRLEKRVQDIDALLTEFNSDSDGANGDDDNIDADTDAADDVGASLDASTDDDADVDDADDAADADDVDDAVVSKGKSVLGCMKKRMQSYERKYRKVKKELIDERDNLQKISAEMETVIEKINQQKQRETQLVQEKKDLSKEIEQSRAENDKKNAELVGVKKDLKSLETEHRVKQDVFKRISDKWKKAQADKDADLANMRSSLEQQTKEICELRSLHTQKEAELTDKLRQVEEMLLERTQDLAQTQRKREEEGRARDAERDELTRRLKDQQTLLDQHRSDADTQTFEASRLATQVETYKEKLNKSVAERQEWLDEMKRCRAEEERTFQQCEELRESLEQNKEENTRDKKKISELDTRNRKLMQQNARLIGHQNPKQKIQHHMKIKKENDKLRTEKNSLEIEVRKLRKKFGVAADKMSSICDGDDTEKLQQELSKVVSERDISVNKLKQLTTVLLTLSNLKLDEGDNSDDEGDVDKENNQLRANTGRSRSSSRTRYSLRSRSRSRPRLAKDEEEFKDDSESSGENGGASDSADGGDSDASQAHEKETDKAEAPFAVSSTNDDLNKCLTLLDSIRIDDDVASTAAQHASASASAPASAPASASVSSVSSSATGAGELVKVARSFVVLDHLVRQVKEGRKELEMRDRQLQRKDRQLLLLEKQNSLKQDSNALAVNDDFGFGDNDIAGFA